MIALQHDVRDKLISGTLVVFFGWEPVQHLSRVDLGHPSQKMGTHGVITKAFVRTWILRLGGVDIVSERLFLGDTKDGRGQLLGACFPNPNQTLTRQQLKNSTNMGPWDRADVGSELTSKCKHRGQIQWSHFILTYITVIIQMVL